MAIETIENRYPERDYLVELGAPEFTSLCPMTGGPDFGELTIRYVPDGKLFELKSLRDYLTGFRDRRILQEEVVNEVLEQLVADGAPRFVEVEGIFNARGGMTTRVLASAGTLAGSVAGKAGGARPGDRTPPASGESWTSD
ncbi:MAG TPA: preQ(1) synthase [Gaiellaceae bacterium]|nr:preQ(1) synthase [Gaiellaceae bacterium]